MSLERAAPAWTEAAAGDGRTAGLGIWSRFDPYMLALIVVLVVQFALIFGRPAPALDGLLNSTDDYMRLVRVSQLAESGAWFDGRIARAALPEGMVLHWTRPMDLVLLAGAALLSPLLGFQAGLLWTGIFISPLLYLGVVLALVWAAAPLLDRAARSLLTLATVAQWPLLVASAVGNADHHMLINLAFVLAIGSLLRALLAPEERNWALAAGGFLGLTLWLTMEALGLLLVGLVTLTLAWLVRGGSQARSNLWHAVGLCGMTIIALLLEQPPGDYLTVAYDRISIVHLLIAGLALAFWCAIGGFEAGTAGRARWRARLGLGALGAVVAGAILWTLYPAFFGGPEAAVDPRLRPVLHDLVMELKPLLPGSRAGLSLFLIYLGSAPLMAGFLAWRLATRHRDAAWWGWAHLAICLAVYLPLAMAMRRFSPFAGLLLSIPLAALVGFAVARVAGWRPAALRLPLQAGLLLALLGAPGGLGVLLEAPSAAASAGPHCAHRQAIARLNDPQGLGARPQQILAHFNHGPELLYRTNHKIVAVPYHRNAASVLDMAHFFAAFDDAAPRAIARRRALDLVMLCPGGPALRQAARHGEGTLAARLIAGQAPAWLQLVEASGAPAGGFLFFRVTLQDR